MMARTQVTLDPQLQRRAHRKAADLGISFAEYIRRLVRRDLRSAVPAGDPQQIFDLGSSGGSDIARDKDRLLGEAIAAEQGSDLR